LFLLNRSHRALVVPLFEDCSFRFVTDIATPPYRYIHFPKHQNSSIYNQESSPNHHRNQQLNIMSQHCSLEDCPHEGPDYKTPTGTFKLIRSLLEKGQEQGTQQNANRLPMLPTNCLLDFYLPFFLIIFAICLTVLVVKMVVNLKAERRTTLIALGEARWMDDSEKGMIRHEGPPVVL